MRTPRAWRPILDLILMIFLNRIGGERGLPVLHWLEYDPIAVTVLVVGIGVVSLLALSI